MNSPPVPPISKISTARMMLPTSTVNPTLSCDHLSCFWLGTIPPRPGHSAVALLIKPSEHSIG